MKLPVKDKTKKGQAGDLFASAGRCCRGADGKSCLKQNVWELTFWLYETFEVEITSAGQSKPILFSSKGNCLPVCE